MLLTDAFYLRNPLPYSIEREAEKMTGAREGAMAYPPGIRQNTNFQ
jgi:hypothetical protein